MKQLTLIILLLFIYQLTHAAEKRRTKAKGKIKRYRLNLFGYGAK